MHRSLPFFAFMHLHLTSNLGTLDDPREGSDVGAESEDGVWWTYPKDGRTKQLLGPEMSPRWCKLTELTLCQIPSKSRRILSLLCFYKYQIELYMFDALGCRSWMKILDAYAFSCQEIYLKSYVGPGSNTCLAMLRSVEVK
jgi:hypothetical protein